MDTKEVCEARHRKEKKDLQGIFVVGHAVRNQISIIEWTALTLLRYYSSSSIQQLLGRRRKITLGHIIFRWKPEIKG